MLFLIIVSTNIPNLFLFEAKSKINNNLEQQAQELFDFYFDKVYKRLVVDVANRQNKEPVEAFVEVYNSWIDYNSSLYCEIRATCMNRISMEKPFRNIRIQEVALHQAPGNLPFYFLTILCLLPLIPLRRRP